MPPQGRWIESLILQFKVVVNQPAGDHGTWGGSKFAPEEEFVEKLKAIEGVTRVETQEYTFETL